MSGWGKKWVTGLVSMAVIGSCLMLSSQLKVAQAAVDDDVQLICDQQSVGVGDTASYHILYHNTKHAKFSHVIVKVQIPEGMDLDTAIDNGAKWDVKTRTLQWDLQDVDQNMALALNFRLKTNSNITSGSKFLVFCSVNEDGKYELETPGVNIQVGPEIDQPFFAGFPDGEFHPDSPITRSQAAAVIARIEHLNDAEPITTYSDVQSNDWAYQYINEVTNAGYMQGFPDGTFHPNAPLSRAELVSLLMRVRGIHAIPLSGFSDTKSHWADKSIGTAKALGYISGEDNDRFYPDRYTTRATAAKLFDIALFRGPLKDGQTSVIEHFPDVAKNNWAFGWVEEAAKIAHQSVHTANGENLLQYLPDQTDKM